MTELLSIRDISQKLGIPQSTLRYYRDIFMEYLPACGEGKKKRFFAEAIDVFAVIAKGMQQNKPAAEISTELNVKFARFIDVNDKNEITGPDTDNITAKNKRSRISLAQSQDNGATNTNTQHKKTSQLQVIGESNLSDSEAIMAIIGNQNKAIKEIAATVHIVTQHQLEIKNLKGELSKLEIQMENQLTKHFQIIDAKLQQSTEKNKPKSFWQKMFG